MAAFSSNDRQGRFQLRDEQPFPDDFHFLAGYLDEQAQVSLAGDVGHLLQDAPLFQQRMPRTGSPLSVRMSNAGEYGWVTDREGGYRYQKTHPVTGSPWPPIPERLLDLWTELTNEQQKPNLCLINFYDADARLGLHQDRGESSLDAPVVSVSLGDDATFVLGGLSRKDPTRRLALHSGDIVWFNGTSRLIFHGVEGIRPGLSKVLQGIGIPSGRINLTLRRISAIAGAT
jgi:DNA oxidative demethylase